jgi:hypothetical protein
MLAQPADNSEQLYINIYLGWVGWLRFAIVSLIDLPVLIEQHPKLYVRFELFVSVGGFAG